MAEETDKAFKEALERLGEDYIYELDSLLRSLGKVASGDLIRSLSTRLMKTGFGTSWTLVIEAEDYLIYVDEGRRAGSRMPPVDPIRKWCREKGIPEGAAFAIAKSIAENGIPPSDVIARALQNLETNRKYDALEDAAGQWAQAITDDVLLSLSKQKNITIR